MRAIVITEPGGPDVLEERIVAAPEPGAGEIRVRVRACGLNRADLLQRRGLYPPPVDVPQDIPGLEFAGTVDAVGVGVSRWRPGDRVMGLVGGGAYAEALVVAGDLALPIPEPLSFDAAAAIPEAFITAHDALFTRLALRPGERLLIHAVGSGVGTAALQLAREAGVRLFGTSRSQWKLERAAAYGLEVGIDPRSDDFADAVLRHTSGDGVDAILDLVGGGYLQDNLRALASQGRMVVVGLVSGRTAELDMGLLLRKRLTLIGTALRSRTHEEKVEATRAFADHALPLFEAGRITPVIDRVIPASDARLGHRLLEADETFGKVVLHWDA